MIEFIIDAFNLSRSDVAPPGLGGSENEHRELLAFIHENRLTGSARNRATAVFDGYEPEGFRSLHPGLTVRFSNSRTADEAIVEMVRAHANPRILVVVSNDREIQDAVRARGARFISCAEFAAPKKKQSRQRSPRRAPKAGNKQQRQITKELSDLWLEDE